MYSEISVIEDIKVLRSWPDVRYMYTIADQAVQPYQSTVIRILTRNKKGSKSIYKCFNDSELKWKIDCGFSTVYKNIRHTTKDTGLIYYPLNYWYQAETSSH